MTMLFRTRVVRALCLFTLAILPGAANAEESSLWFNRDIRPILSSNCFACHGFDAKKRQADLRLDTPEGETADHDGVQAIVPGDLGKSELWRRVTSKDDGELMQRAASNEELPDAGRGWLGNW